jgi:hypothetical protein
MQPFAISGYQGLLFGTGPAFDLRLSSSGITEILETFMIGN